MQPWEACILCSFSTSSSVTIIEIGNKVTFSLTPNQVRNCEMAYSHARVHNHFDFCFSEFLVQAS